MSPVIKTYQKAPKGTCASSLRLLLDVYEVKASYGKQSETEWRGTIIDVDSGRIATFEDWPELVDRIADALYGLRRQPV